MAGIRARRLVKFRNEDRFAYVEQRKGSGNKDGGGNNSGVKWSSCNQSVSQVDFSPIFAVGSGKGGWSPVMWLFLLPGLAIAGISIGISTPAISAGGATFGLISVISAVEAALATLGLTLAALTGMRSLALLDQLGNAIAAFLPPGSRVQFIEYTKPCSEEDYEGD